MTMLFCGRSLAKCLTAVIALASIGSLGAAPYLPVDAVGSRDIGPKPLIVPAPLRGQDRNFSGYGRAQATESIADYPRTNSSEQPQGLPLEPPHTASELSEPVSPASWTMPPDRSQFQQTPPVLGHWVAVVGAVAKPGCYELPSRSIAVAELMERCGGLTSAASGTLAVVRDGRAVGLAYNPQDRLLGGDVIVVAEKPAIRSRVTATGLKEESESAGTTRGVQLGLVNVLDRPVPVLVPTSHATVTGILEIANQTHLRPDQIKVIMGGTDEMFGDRSTALTPGTVLVFPPGSVNTAALGEVTTRFYPALAQGRSFEPGPISDEPATQSLDAAPSMLAAPATDAPESVPARMPTAELGRSVPAADLSSLPRVEMLDAPADDSLRFPRTADASGAMPIGAPEAGSHIVPFPSDAVETAAKSESSAPPTPSAVTLPDEADSEAESTGLPTFAELGPTLLIGTILGAATFFGLRHWRKRRLMESIGSRLSALPQTFRVTKPAPAPETRVFSPDDMLAALVANRLALREEAIVLTPALQLYGRSSAMKHRRIDPPSAEIARPHIPVRSERAAGARDLGRADSGDGGELQSDAQRLRFDEADATKQPKHKDAASTPFERALAAMHSRQ